MGAPSRLRAPTRVERGAAATSVASHLSPTPLWDAGRSGTWLKLETAQPTGSFKVRGALVALSLLPAGVRAVSASAGNHALGMAWAAGRLGVPVTVVTAETASEAKLAAIRTLAAVPGARVELVTEGRSYEEAESLARRLAHASPDSAVYVSAYSDWAVIAGGSTLGVELDAVWPAPEPVTVVCSLGGGGLASGLLLWALDRPGTRIVAAQAAASPGAGRSAAAGRVVGVEVSPTVADGLAGNLEQGSPTPALLHRGTGCGVLRIVDVSEDAIETAMRQLFSEHGLVVEGAGAAAAAVLLESPAVVAGPGPTVVVLSGRNVSASTYAGVLTPS